MLTRDFFLGAGTALLTLCLIEGIALLMAYRANKKLKIAKIYEDAHDSVEKLSDQELLDKLANDFKSDG